jgi:hypothetical protein
MHKNRNLGLVIDAILIVCMFLLMFNPCLLTDHEVIYRCIPPMPPTPPGDGADDLGADGALIGAERMGEGAGATARGAALGAGVTERGAACAGAVKERGAAWAGAVKERGAAGVERVVPGNGEVVRGATVARGVTRLMFSRLLWPRCRYVVASLPVP